MHPFILYELQEKMSKALYIIFNKSPRDGAIPNDWKTSYTYDIYKKGRKSEASNYRPVSLTCIVCKLLEGVRGHVMPHMFENNFSLQNSSDL